MKIQILFLFAHKTPHVLIHSNMNNVAYAEKFTSASKVIIQLDESENECN